LRGEIGASLKTGEKELFCEDKLFAESFLTIDHSLYQTLISGEDIVAARCHQSGTSSQLDWEKLRTVQLQVSRSILVLIG